ncbi:MAG: IS110 family transposase [Bacteroidetes bacterium]|nr:IS110 family transposase [Bacteroidota bacterium]
MSEANLQQKVTYADKNIFVGLDVHEKSWNVSIFLDGMFIRSFTQPPSPEGLKTLLTRDYPQANYLCGYESGYSAFSIQRQLQSQGIACHVLHAGDIPQTGKEKLMKRDPVDSKKIGEALSSKKGKPIYVPDVESEQDRALVRYRDRLQRDLTRGKNRIRSFLYEFGILLPDAYQRGWSNHFIQWLKETPQVTGSARITLDRMIEQMITMRGLLLKVNRDIRLLATSPKYKQRVKYLTSIPGIGPLSAIIILTELIDIKRFGSFRALNSFVGFYPMEHSTGEREHKGSIMIRHNKHLRKLLVEDAWVAMRHDPALTLAYNHWALKMSGKRAIVKVARKLLNRIKCVLSNEIFYEKGIE